MSKPYSTPVGSLPLSRGIFPNILPGVYSWLLRKGDNYVLSHNAPVWGLLINSQISGLKSADFNLVFPSARAEIKFIYMQDVFTDSDSMWSERKQRQERPGLNLTDGHGRGGGRVWACGCAVVFVWWHFAWSAGRARFINHKHELMDPITPWRYVCLLSSVKSKERREQERHTCTQAFPSLWNPPPRCQNTCITSRVTIGALIFSPFPVVI